MLQAFKTSASYEAGNVGVTVSRAESPTVVDKAVVEKRAAIRIKRILNATELVDEAGVELHPFLRSLQIELMQ